MSPRQTKSQYRRVFPWMVVGSVLGYSAVAFYKGKFDWAVLVGNLVGVTIAFLIILKFWATREDVQ